MKKKALSLLLAATMVAAALTGCGSEGGEASAPVTESKSQEASKTPEASKEESTAPAAEEGKVLNIYCWNEEFKTRITDHYPGYTEVDGTNGTIGDIAVKWNITPNENNAYQNNLDEALLKQESAAADDKIDLFLVEADYALKYVNTDYTMPVADIGVTEADLANQYQYTKDVVTDGEGKLKGVSWQGCPGVLIYRRSIAKDVFGTDDPAEIQKKLADWDTFTATAKEVQDKGYFMTSSAVDTYRTYSNNVSTKWVVDNKIVIDDNIMAWVDASKEMVDAGQTGTYDLWSDDWKKGFFEDGKVFCYFGPAWFADFTLGGNGIDGDWAATEGPQGFFWGGTWICAATGTDNVSLVKDIMLQMTTNEELMKGIVTADNDFVNNKPAMEAMAADTTYQNKVLGGQNPLAMYCASVESIDLSNLSNYDQGCNEEFQKAMLNYFKGNASKEEALDLFYKAVEEKYPELSH